LAAADRADSGTLREVEAIVREAGALALRSFRGTVKSWTKGASSPVCEIDIAVDHFLRDRLQALGSGRAWLSEETEDDPERLSAAEVWVVDPIDGTRSYLEHRPDWTVSVALVRNDRPVLAVLFAPATEEMFLAAAGGGATCNAAPIRCSEGSVLDRVAIAGPRGHLKRLAEAAPIMETPRIGSLALRFARVAQGRIDGALASRNAHDWDLAAADLLVHEAGGLVTTLAGRSLSYNQPQPVHGALVAAGIDRHPALLAVSRQQLAQFA
jgi:myo-inositol-1(or 4)-monophosphatase